MHQASSNNSSHCKLSVKNLCRCICRALDQPKSAFILPTFHCSQGYAGKKKRRGELLLSWNSPNSPPMTTNTNIRQLRVEGERELRIVRQEKAAKNESIGLCLAG